MCMIVSVMRLIRRPWKGCMMGSHFIAIKFIQTIRENCVCLLHYFAHNDCYNNEQKMLKLSTSKCGRPKEYTESRTWIWFIWYGGCPVRRLLQANSSQTNSMTSKWNQFLCKFAQNNVTCVYCQMVFSACELPFRFVWKQASPTFGQSQVVDVPICPWNMFGNLEISIIFLKKTITISLPAFCSIHHHFLWYWNPPLCWTQPQLKTPLDPNVRCSGGCALSQASTAPARMSRGWQLDGLNPMDTTLG